MTVVATDQLKAAASPAWRGGSDLVGSADPDDSVSARVPDGFEASDLVSGDDPVDETRQLSQETRQFEADLWMTPTVSTRTRDSIGDASVFDEQIWIRHFRSDGVRLQKPDTVAGSGEVAGHGGGRRLSKATVFDNSDKMMAENDDTTRLVQGT